MAQFMPRCLQCVESESRELFLYQHVVCIVGRDGEDGHTILRERFDEGEQYSGLREGERAFEFQANPGRAGIGVLRDVRGGTNDREFVSRAGD